MFKCNFKKKSVCMSNSFVILSKNIRLSIWLFGNGCWIKEIFHPKNKICRKLHLHILFKPMFFIFFKNVFTSSGSISGQKMWLRWPVFRAPMASILGSKVQYSKLRGQYFRLQGQYFELHGQYFSSIGSTLAPGAVP